MSIVRIDVRDLEVAECFTEGRVAFKFRSKRTRKDGIFLFMVFVGLPLLSFFAFPLFFLDLFLMLFVIFRFLFRMAFAKDRSYEKRVFKREYDDSL